jgi:stearoyl-CoA desaturase (Delta-9 desaturase)
MAISRPETVLLHDKAARRERTAIGLLLTASLAGAVYGLYLVATGQFTTANVMLFAVMCLVTASGIEVGFHRLLAHRSFKTGNAVRVWLGITGSMAGQGPICYWVSHHRLHHVHSDDESDPHTPTARGEGIVQTAKGLLHAHVLWMFSRRRASVGVFARDLVGDPLIRFVDRHYHLWVVLGVALPGLANGAISGSVDGIVPGMVFGGLARMFVVDHVVYSVNSVCHSFGRQRFDTKDRSRNNFVLAIPTLGQSWHNNHHAFPASARMGLHWWEIDIGYWIILCLKRLSLAWDVFVPDRSRRS